MFKRVLVGVDGRPSGRDAIALASQLLEPGGRLTLAQVYQRINTVGYGIDPFTLRRAASENAAAEALEVLEQERAEAGVEAELVAVAAPTPGQGLHEEAERQEADLLVLGTCSHGIIGRAILGNDTRAAINGASCAILVAPLGYAEHPKQIQTIGVGYDGSPESKAALETAQALARRLEAKVRARKVVELPSMGIFGVIGSGLTDWIEDADKHMRELPGVEGDAVYGISSEELAIFSDQCDLLVVGSRGFGPLRRVIFGSTSDALQSRARCPLLILPRASTVGSAHHEEGVSESAQALAGR